MKLFVETYADVADKYDERVEFPPDRTKIISVAKRDMQDDEFRKFALPLLYPNGRAIATKKMVDLLELLDLIPIVGFEFRSFYTNLNHTNEEEQSDEPVEDIVEISDEEILYESQ